MATTLKSTYESILFGRIRPCSVVLSRFSPVQFFTTPWTVAHQAPVHGVSQARILEWVAISFSRSLFKFMSIESVMPSNHLFFCHPFLLPPSTFPRFRVFSLSQFFPSGGQSIGASASASVLISLLVRLDSNWFSYSSLKLLLWVVLLMVFLDNPKALASMK